MVERKEEKVRDYFGDVDMSLQTGQTSSLTPEIYQTFFNEGIDKKNKNTDILIITVKVAPSVMMGCDGIKTV